MERGILSGEGDCQVEGGILLGREGDCREDREIVTKRGRLSRGEGDCQEKEVVRFREVYCQE